MGIVNVTPDSFSDGGQFTVTKAAVEHGIRLAAECADILDIGGESSRPGAKPVSLDEELARVVPVIRELASKTSIPISIDTTKAEVARQAIDAGASIVNDISAGLGDPDMMAVVRSSGAGFALMHMQGTPVTMQENPSYVDVVGEVKAFLESRLDAALKAGISNEQLCVDPGIGFGKTSAHNMTLLRELGKIASIGRPVMLGVSRKGIIGYLTTRSVPDRLPGSIAAASYCMAMGTAHVIRVHDVAATYDATRVVAAIRSI